MAATLTRDQLLANFLVKAYQHYDGDPPCSVTSLLAELAGIIPHEAFELQEPRNQAALIGEIDEDLTDEFFESVWFIHYTQPIETPLVVLLSSSGGSVDHGSAIIALLTELRRQGRRVIVHVAGSAMSTAFDIVQCADYRIAEPSALLMTHHEHFGLDDSDAVNGAKEYQASITRSKLVYEQLSQRTGRPVKYYMDKVKGTQWYITPEEALKEGLIDEILAAPAFAPTPAQNGNGKAAPRKRTPKVPTPPPPPTPESMTTTHE